MSQSILLEHIDKSIQGRRILDDINLGVESGDIFGFLGPNGAGKTTTIRIILGLYLPDSGKVKIQGRPGAFDDSRRYLGFVLETDGLYDNITARENLALYCCLYRFPPAYQTARIEEVLKIIGLLDRADDKVGTYSKGMRQKLAIARAMVHDPELLILDEPTAGVDPTGQIEVRELVLDLAARGKTVFFSSHNLDEVQRICNRVALIDRGRVKLHGKLEELRNDREGYELEVIIRGSPDAEITASAVEDLLALAFVNACRREKDRFILGISGEADVGAIIDALARHEIRVDEIRKQQKSLEYIYATALQEAQQ